MSVAAALFFLAPGRQALLLAAVFVVSLGTGLLDTFSQPSINAALPYLVRREKLEAANEAVERKVGQISLIPWRVFLEKLWRGVIIS